MKSICFDRSSAKRVCQVPFMRMGVLGCLLALSVVSHAQGQAGNDRPNIFDPQRAVWPDRVPLPPPPPPPPPPAPVTDDDLQLYGVMIVGPEKRALVKLGKRFAAANPSGRPFVTLRQGQSIGEFTLEDVQAGQLTLVSGIHRQNMVFTKKADRPAPGAPVPVVQGPSQPAPDAAAQPPAAARPYPAAAAAGASPGGGAVSGQPAAPTQQAVAPAVNSNVDASAVLQNAPPGSLAAAIAAAQQAAAQRPAGTAPATFNPFMQRP